MKILTALAHWAIVNAVIFVVVIVLEVLWRKAMYRDGARAIDMNNKNIDALLSEG